MRTPSRHSIFRAPSFRGLFGERVGSHECSGAIGHGVPPISQSARKGWGTGASSARWLKGAEAVVLAVAICFSLGASTPTGRLNTLSHHLMCQCGCSQVLGECDHVGCPDRDKELSELSSAIDSGLGDQQILDAFAAKYGETVLAAPRTTGFDLVAWIAPFAVFAAALLGTILLIRRWGGLGRKTQIAVTGEVAALDSGEIGPAEQERMERIRRETGSDGGF
jgi:cytochrome c-type biogenesis protein CcmH/NrfF